MRSYKLKATVVMLLTVLNATTSVAASQGRWDQKKRTDNVTARDTLAILAAVGGVVFSEYSRPIAVDVQTPCAYADCFRESWTNLPGAGARYSASLAGFVGSAKAVTFADAAICAPRGGDCRLRPGIKTYARFSLPTVWRGQARVTVLTLVQPATPEAAARLGFRRFTLASHGDRAWRVIDAPRWVER